MDPNSALRRIAATLDGVEWDSDVIEQVASVVRDAGYTIRDPNDVDPDEDIHARLTRVTLDISWDARQHDDPATWSWPELLDCAPDDVTVVDTNPSKKENPS